MHLIDIYGHNFYLNILNFIFFITFNITKFLTSKPYRAFYNYNCEFVLISTKRVNCFLALNMELLKRK